MFNVIRCHLAYVYESLVFCIILSVVFRTATCRLVEGLVVALDLAKLPLVEIRQVADRAQRLRRHSAAFADNCLFLLRMKVVFNVLKIHLLVLEFINDPQVLHVLSTNHSEIL